MSLIRLGDRDVQNAQEMAAVWGEIRTEFEQHNATLEESYAILGEHDFLIIFEADDHEAGFKSALTLRRHGLRGQTMELVDTDDFSDLVDEI
ncbi:GYD domain-containing protein [Salinadaptatus halalkaliphilus]|uniref:GYD domain-containing protein n=1 Tax=Salinadaptatus halalkaliphilus TaxID=2419781 RepID=A0A4S3TRY9_9EURY|nr:GYD domain-containing protein [Salinadaptatus halalkaliphilus]THE66450.1 GYD domain-containing protein [Salinadaptatus halalkaliphilus]